jgi:tetratricopeptide (TPR) repeat protein
MHINFTGGQVTSKPQVLAEPVLVGREKELRDLQGFLNAAIEGKGQAVFVSGEAGVGKTRLVNEFLNLAKKQAVTILTGWCLSKVVVPYFPFFEAFRKYFSAKSEIKDLNVKNWLLGPPQSEKLANLQTVTPQVWKDQTFTAVASALISISTKTPVILFIDDLHWADSASLALIHYLANIVSSEKVLIIATFRTEELAADNDGRPHPLLETIRLMRRQDLIEEINVLSLDETGVSKLVKSMLCSSLQQEFTQKLTEESQGNPLFVVESIRMLYESKSLIQENGTWHLTSTSIGIPQKIKDIILQRLSLLPKCKKNVLEAAAVIGVEFDSTLLAAVLGKDSIEIIEALDSVANDTSLVCCLGQLYSFDHARTREIIYNDISPALQRAYHAKSAEKLEAMSKDDKLLLSNVAFHYAQAGNKSEAVKYALAAGQNALLKWSNKESVDHFAFVLQAVGKEPQYEQEKRIAIEGLGDAYFASDNFAQAIEAYERLADIQPDAAKLRVLRKAIRAASIQGDVCKQKTLIQKAEVITAADRLEAGRILYEKGTVLGGENDWVTGFKLIEDALQVFDEEYALSDAASILPLLGYGAANQGYLERGILAALRSIALYEELGDFRSQIDAYAYAGGTFQACTLYQISNRMLAKAVELNEQLKIMDYVKVIPAYVWWSIGLIGVDLATSISKVLKALEYSEKTDSRLYTGAMYGVLIMAHGLSEDTAGVDKYFDKLMSLPKQILSNGPTQVYLSPAMAVYYCTKKEYEKSNNYFNQSLAVAQLFFPNPFIEASTRQLFAWALGKQGKMEEAKSQLKQAEEIIEVARRRFSHVNIQSSLMTLAKPEVNQTFPIRLDLVNVSTNQGSIIRIENLLVTGLKIVDTSTNCLVQNDEIMFKNHKIGAFEVKTIKLTMQAAKPGAFYLTPTIAYVNELGERKTESVCRTFPQITYKDGNKAILSHTHEPVKIVVNQTALPKPQVEKTELTKFLNFEFETESAKKAFDFLVNSFVQDYMQRRLPLEWSGWRTMMDVIRNAGISKRMVYGVGRRNGRAISELERRGVIEIRVFPKERGRGGRIQKARISYEKEIIARLVDERIIKPANKQ